ncbi:hypothetical protein [Azospirillum sp. ST 5-10]|uniref:hypothetical protein n=1 Tax=unclassified Azospirillum TaxID=2630922 RepID=UPI003F4A4B4B
MTHPFSTPALLLVAGLAAPAAPAAANDYPTAARAEYVFTCMAANGQTAEMLQKCSCSIDAIAERMPYEQYERAETVMTMQQVTGARAGFFREAAWAKQLIADFERAQADANLKCF